MYLTVNYLKSRGELYFYANFIDKKMTHRKMKWIAENNPITEQVALFLFV